MTFAQIWQKNKPAAIAAFTFSMALPAFADAAPVGGIDWGGLATQVLAVLGQAVAAGVSVFAMYLGVSAGIKMFKKFIG